MARIPLLGGAYMARSGIANAQRCVNLYPEGNTKDAPVPVTHYLTPGLGLLAEAPTGPVRGLYMASDGQGYMVASNTVYAVSSTWGLTVLGTINTTTGPVAMKDNGFQVLLVDGSTDGWTITLGTNVFAQLVDPTGLFQGSIGIGDVDGYTILNTPNSRQMISTLFNTLTFDGLYYVSKVGNSDLLVTIAVVHREIWLLGQTTSEVFYNAGGATFPFAIMPGAFLQHGCAAAYSVATFDLAVYWLGSDPAGHGIVFRGSGYTAKRVSNHALEYAIQGYADISDAIGFIYQQDGHTFYQLTFPSANATWVYDEATEEWHQRGWTSQDGTLNRHRANCYAFMYGKHVVGDWENGNIYDYGMGYGTDAGVPIRRVRTFPHMSMQQGALTIGYNAMDRGQRIGFTQFMADMAVGLQSPAGGTAPTVGLRWSDDRGQTWGNTLVQSIGSGGEYRVVPQWRRLGYARDRVWELSWSSPAITALNGAWIDAVSALT